MKTYISMLLICVVTHAHAQTKKQTVNSTVDKVTVFLQGAQVTRSANTTIPAGTTVLVFPQISPDLEEKSIQVQGQGAFTILSVAREKNYLRGQAPLEEAAKLQDQIDVLNEKLAYEEGRKKIFAQEEIMLSKNQEIRGANTGMKTSELKEALDFQRARLTEVTNQQITITKNIRLLNESIIRLMKQQQELSAAKDTTTNDLLITVSSKESISGKFTLSYLVKNAGWYPSYDVRVDNITQPMHIAYKANVFQKSGEEWKNVKLSLSNGNPSESGSRPELKPWVVRTFYSQYELQQLRNKSKPGVKNEVTGRITDESGNPIPAANVSVTGRTIGTNTDANGNFSLQLPTDATSISVSYIGYEPKEIPLTGQPLYIAMIPNNNKLEEVVVVGYGTQRKEALTGSVSGLAVDKANIRIRGVSSLAAPAPPQSEIPLEVNTAYLSTSVHFDIATAYTILSDGKPYAVNIQEMDVPASYEYHAAPKIDLSAYLIAGITDWEKLNLLEGETSIYFEGTYLGKSLLNLQTASDTLFVSMGKDKGIVLNRTLQKSYSKTQVLGSNSTVARNWEISVRNNKREAVHLILEDQLPMSVSRDIEISKAEYAGGRLDEVTQKVTWDMNIGPKKEEKVKLLYTIKYPKDRIVNVD